MVRAGNLYPVIRQKTMKGGPLDRRLYGRKQSPPQGAGRSLGTRPAAIPPRPGTPGACRCCRLFPSLSTRRSERPEAVSARKRPEAQKGRALPSPCGPPATSPGPTFIIPLSRRQRRVERDSNGHTGVWAHAPCPSPCQKLGTEEGLGLFCSVLGVCWLGSHPTGPFSSVPGSTEPLGEKRRLVGSQRTLGQPKKGTLSAHSPLRGQREGAGRGLRRAKWARSPGQLFLVSVFL